MIKVVSHKAPDTDAVASSIVWAWFLSRDKGVEAKAYISSEANREAAYVLEKFGYEMPEMIEKLTAEDTVAIVDTNNPDELPDGINDTQILGIVDHHKLVGGLSTSEPIPVMIEPLASTCSVIWTLFERERVEDMPVEIAGLMLAAIVSDTLKFTSPTTTNYDRKLAMRLSEIIKVDIDELADGMFTAKSNLDGMSAEDILTSDSKIFEMGPKKVRVSVLETTKPTVALEMADSLRDGMKALKDKEGLDMAFFFVVDILESSSQVLVTTDEEQAIGEKAFEASFENGVMVLPGVVSRKKQMVPKLEAVIE